MLNKRALNNAWAGSQPVTAKLAAGLQYGAVLYHVTRTGHDGAALRVRVCGKYKLTRYGWRLPVMWGLYSHMQITHDNAGEWVLVVS